MEDEGVTLFSSSDPSEANALANALRAAELQPTVESTGDRTFVKLPRERISEGAKILAAFQPSYSIPAPPLPAREPKRPGPRRAWAAVTSISIALAFSLGALRTAFALAGLFFAVYRLVIARGVAKGARLPTITLISALTAFVLFVVQGEVNAAGVAWMKQAPAVAAAMILSVGVIVSLVCVIQSYASPSLYRVGRGRAWWALGLTGGVMVPATIASVIGVGLPQQAPPDLGSVQQPGSVITNDDLNFRLTAPPRPWAQLDAKKIIPDATLAFTKDSKVWFVLIAESGGGKLTAEGLIELWRSRHAAIDKKFKFVPPRRMKLNGLDALEATTERLVGGQAIFSINWAYARNGYLYQLLVWGASKEQDRIRSEGWQIASTFELIDPARSSPEEIPSRPAERFTSPAFGYTVDLDSEHWNQRDETYASPVPDYVAYCGKQSVLEVIAWPLLGEKLPREAITRALSWAVTMDLGAPGIRRSPYRSGAFEGEEVFGTSTRSGSPLALHLRAVSTPTLALLVMQASPNPVEPGCADALDRVTLTRPGKITRTSIPHPDTARWLFESAASFLSLEGQLPLAMKLLRRALQLNPASLETAWTLAEVSSKAGKLADAEKILGVLLAKAPDNSPLYAVRAAILERRGHPQRAIADYARLFGAGYEEDDTFAAYVHLLEKQRRRSEAFVELERYRQHRDTALVTILEAGLHQRSGQVARAVEILKRRLEGGDPDESLGLTLVQLYQAADRDREAISTCDQLLVQGRGSAALLVAKARSEVALHSHAAAKRTLEAARRRAPDDQEIERMLDYVSSMLGEGANSAMKEPISAVPIPPHLLDAAEPAPPEGARAVYLSRATAISFVSGRDYRTTDQMTVRVLDQAGVDLFSTLSFEFDPRQERIFLNKLRTFDAQGALVATGSVSACYLSDQASEEIGTSRRTLYVPVPGLNPGSSFELTLTRAALVPPSSIWFTPHLFTASVPMNQSALFLVGDVARVRELARGVEARSVGSGRAWVVKNAHPYEPEPFDPPLDQIRPVLWLGDRAASWESELEEYRREIEPLLKIQDGTRQLAERLVRGHDTPESRIAILARHVQKELSYKAIEFGRGARVPRPAEDVVGRKYGDCKDHALLLSQLLRAAGVDAELALVKSWGRVTREVPSLDQFDHMIVHLPGPSPRFIDATMKWSSPDETVAGLLGQEALIVKAGPAQLVNIARLQDQAPKELEIERTVEVAKEGGLLVRETVLARGWTAVVLREVLSSSEPHRRSEKLTNWIGPSKIQALKIEELTNPEKPIRLELTYKADGSLHRAGDQLVAKLPAEWEHGRIATRAVESRANPFEIRWPLAVTSRTRFLVPDGFEVVPLSARSSDPAAAAFGRWALNAEAEAHQVVLSFSYERTTGAHKAADYAVFHRDIEAALAALGQPLVLKK